MKKILLSIIALVCCATVYAQDKNISVENIEFDRKDGRVSASFEVKVGRKATRSRDNLVVKPILRNGSYSFELPNIIVQGRRAAIADKRHMTASGMSAYGDDALFTRNKSTLAYTADFPVQEWMRGSDLVFEAVSVGCCSAKRADIGLIAKNVLWTEPVTEYFTVIEEIPIDVFTTGDSLARIYPFMAPITELAHDGSFPPPEDSFADYFVEQNREGSLSVYFRQGSRTIDKGFSSNGKTLSDMIASINALRKSSDSRVVGVIIAGFASPEGGAQMNSRLAGDRAAALKNYVLDNTWIEPSKIATYNGAVDWTRLRQLVDQSNMPWRRQVLDIIDSVPVWSARNNTGRLGQIMLLSGGEAYRYMLRNFFPELRQAAYIKVFYENL